MEKLENIMNINNTRELKRVEMKIMKRIERRENKINFLQLFRIKRKSIGIVYSEITLARGKYFFYLTAYRVNNSQIKNVGSAYRGCQKKKN